MSETIELKKNLTEEELKKLQMFNDEFTKAKVALGDIELQKQQILAQVNLMQEDFSKLESELVEKYGDNSVVNIQTGEVTPKEKE